MKKTSVSLSMRLVSELYDVYIEDYISANGTLVNGEKIKPGGSHKLKSGDKINANKSELEYKHVRQSAILLQGQEQTARRNKQYPTRCLTHLRKLAASFAISVMREKSWAAISSFGAGQEPPTEITL